MSLRTALFSCTAAVVLATSAALAAIDGNALADSYLAQGYSFVEVKVGPTQTKVEAVKGTVKVEVIYDNATQSILKQDEETADAEYLGRTGKEVRTIGRDFKDAIKDGKGKHGDAAKDDKDDHDDQDDDKDDDEDDDHDDDHGGDHGGDKS